MPDDEEGLERLAKYVVRAPISQERAGHSAPLYCSPMRPGWLYIPAAEASTGSAQVIYTGKNSRVDERFTALDWAGRRQACCSPMQPGWPAWSLIFQTEENNWLFYGSLIVVRSSGYAPWILWILLQQSPGSS